MGVRIPRQKRSMERKVRIMEAARELFGRKGVGGTSSNEIAREAGVSIGTFYSYFENKRTLFLQILEEHLQTFISDIYPLKADETIPMKDDIKNHIQKAFRVFDRHPSFHREALVLKFTDAEVKALFDEVECAQLLIISELVKPYCRKKNPEDLQEVSKVMHSAVENIAHAVKFLDSPLDTEKLVDELAEMLSHYVNSL